MPLKEIEANKRCCILSSYFGDDTKDTNNISLELYQTGTTDKARAYINKGTPNVVCGTIEENTKNNIKFSVSSSKVSALVNENSAQSDASLAGAVNAAPYIFVDRNKRFDTFTVPMRLYSMKIYSGNNLVANYVPALNAEQVPGLVNLTTGQFLTTPSGSAFDYGEYEPKAGRIFVDENNSYRVVEYIESPSTGSVTNTAYIDTGIKSTGNTAIEIDAIQYTSTSYYGGTVSNSYNCTTSGAGLNYFYCNSGTQLGTSASSVIGVRTVLKQDGLKCYRDGELVATATDSAPNDSKTILLCARRDASGNGTNDGGKTRVYSCKL
jgi:hypothetical protein